MLTWTATTLLFLAGTMPVQDKPEPAHEHPSAEQAIDLLKQIQGLMLKSEDLLNDSSRGKSLETEEAILKRIGDLLKDDPASAQKKTLEKIARLMEKSEGSQKDAIERMTMLLQQLKPCGGGN